MSRCQNSKSQDDLMEKQRELGKEAEEEMKILKRDLEEKQVEIESLQEEFVTTIQIKGELTRPLISFDLL